ncbi:MAG TPA: hypothetical protein ENJ05_03235 [Thiotrichales bacterium]|nr:hypothetical protein [Thiotrichales bacterium]
MKHLKKTPSSLLSLCLTGLLTACGGGGGSNGDDLVPSEEGSVTLSGSVFAAPVRGASVTLSDCSGHELTAPAVSDEGGAYRFSIPSDYLNGDLCILATGGVFDDEATGTRDRPAGRLAAFVPAGGMGPDASVHLTPGSTIIHDLITRHGQAPDDARALFLATFGYAPDLGVAPTDATRPATSDKASQRAGLRAALFSQLTMELGLLATDQFSLLEALARDLADGTLDGGDDGGPISVTGTSVTLPADILNRYANAMYEFRAGGREATDLGNAELGTLPFARLALTNNYRVEYLDDGAAPTEGKSSFRLKISDADGNPAPGLAVSLMPMMYMSGMAHGTPVAEVTDVDSDGIYDATVYYLMASSMMNGMSMGYWKLDIMVGGEKATFYPNVMMAMGDSVKATLKGGQTDMIAAMDMSGGMDMGHDMGGMAISEEPRSYYIFKDALMAMSGSYTLKLFIAAKENMMSYSPVYPGATLGGGQTDLIIDGATTTVEVSTDGGTTWIAAMPDSATGIWTVTGLTGLTDGEQTEIQVRLTVNGERKTSDGTASGLDAILRLTPGGMSMSM